MSEQDIQRDKFQSFFALGNPEWVLYCCDGCEDYFILDKRCDIHVCPWCECEDATAIGEGEFKITKWGDWRNE